MASCQNQPSMASLRQSFLQWHSSLKEGHWVDSLCVAQKCCFIPPPDCSISSANTRWIQYLYYHVRGRETMPGISWEVPDWTPEGTPGLHRGPVEHSWGRSLSQLLRTEHLCVFPPPQIHILNSQSPMWWCWRWSLWEVIKSWRQSPQEWH